MSLSVRTVTRTALLLAVTVALQMLRLPQPVTGPLVNAMLILTTALVGMFAGVFVGALTPWIGFAMGILPPLLGPAIPFIMAGNAVLVIAFGLSLRLAARSQRELPHRLIQIAGIVVGGLLKFVVISAAVYLILDVPEAVAAALQLPQLFTAWTGGAVALVVLGLLGSVGFLREMVH